MSKVNTDESLLTSYERLKQTCGQKSKKQVNRGFGNREKDAEIVHKTYTAVEKEEEEQSLKQVLWKPGA